MSDYQILAEHQRAMFLKNSPELSVQEDEYGYPCMELGEEVVPLYTADTQFTIVQPGSVQQDKNLAPHKGKFMIHHGGEENEFAPELWLLPITVVNRGFTKYIGDYNSQSPAQRECWSYNGFVHEPDVAQPYNDRCAVLEMRKGAPFLKAVCPAAQFVNGQRPLCRAHTTVAFFDLKRRIPLRFQFHGTALKSWSDLSADFERFKNSARRNGRNPNKFVLHATLEDQGTYYKPNFQFLYEAPEVVSDPVKYKNVLHWYLMTLYANQPAAAEAQVNPQTGEVYDVETTAENVTEIGF